MWYNKHLLVDKKPLYKGIRCFKNVKSKMFKLKHLYQDKTLLSKKDLCRLYNINISQMDYNSILASIPKKWKSIIKHDDTDLNLSESNMFFIRKINKNILKVSNKEVYSSIVEHTKPPSSQNKWVEYYPFLELINWENIYCLPQKLTSDPRLISFQYSILHRFITCNYILHLWKLKDTNKCNLCNEVDSIEHLLFWCQDSKSFWKNVENFLANTQNLSFKFTLLEVLLGIPCRKYSMLSIINYVLLLGKWFIHKSKIVNSEEIDFLEFINILKKKLEIELYVAKCKMQNDNYIEYLEEFYDNF